MTFPDKSPTYAFNGVNSLQVPSSTQHGLEGESPQLALASLESKLQTPLPPLVHVLHATGYFDAHSALLLAGPWKVGVQKPPPGPVPEQQVQPASELESML